MRRGLPALAIVAAVLSTAGCGGGSSTAGTNGGGAHSAASSTATVATASRTESSGSASAPVSGSVTRADAICKRLISELRHQELNRGAQVAQIASRRAAMEQATLAELREITPPASIAHDYQMLLADRQTLIEDTAKLGSAIVAKNKQMAARVFTSSGVVLKRMKDVGRRNGFTYCGVIG
jgi:hypothetical protein